ncbi:MAG TPA: type 2 lanthipeptide synthetase LanM, partial [Blastocatellia bacterium]|nr:type 2 lanthipeptide synthetase LanM [Blastocatellia bacterium]
VLRATKTYSLLLGESYHPDVLRDALDRDRLLDRLWIGIENRPHSPRTIPAEQADLQGGDIPLFSTRPGSRHIWTSTNQTIPDFLNESSLDAVRRRIGVLDEEDLSRQAWFIRASLSTLTMGKGQTHWKGYETVEPSGPVTREDLIAAARKVAERIDLLAMRGGDSVSWLGITLINERSWNLLPVTGDLYSGIPGIALFLGYFASVTGEERYSNLARLAIGPLRKQIEVELPQGPLRGAIGGFTGWGGLVYALTHLSSIWSEPALIAEAEAVAGQLSEQIQQDQALDVISGSAGCIGALMSLYRYWPSERTLATAIQCGERLLERAQSHESGAAWMTTLKSTQPLTGYSHGAAGMAWALLQLAAASGEKRFERAAREAIAYERAVFDPEKQNWPDFRDMSDFQEDPQNEPRGRMMCAWCHGAPGIGLSRIGMMPYLDDAELISEIRTAVNSTFAKGFGNNHSLCHGDLGNIDLLLEAERLNKNLVSKTDLDRVTAVIHNSIKSNGWLCGVPLGVETPGLLTGLAGIGYELLRLAEPDRVPSVLMLAPPLRTC